MKIERFVLGPVQTNTYLVYNENSKEGVIIDPAVYDTEMIRTINEVGLNIKYILITHGHFDHVTGLSELKKQVSAPICMNPADLAIMPIDEKGMVNQVGFSFEAFQPDINLSDNQQLKVGSLNFSVIHTPGHTPGCVCFYFAEEKVLFSGDTLFQSAIGRTDFPLGSYEQIISSITNKLLTLPESANVYPGHGEQTTIRQEKLHFIA
jgi:glyoxylase-like metal-dependent hydrolase (beta-lactamase superfamily II)